MIQRNGTKALAFLSTYFLQCHNLIEQYHDRNVVVLRNMNSIRMDGSGTMEGRKKRAQRNNIKIIEFRLDLKLFVARNAMCLRALV